MDKKLRPNSNIIERLADSLRAEAKAPAGAFVVLILLYIISVVLITVVARGWTALFRSLLIRLPGSFPPCPTSAS